MWEHRGGIVERGDPTSLMLCRPNPSKTVQYAPVPGATRKRDWAPIAANLLKPRKVSHRRSEDVQCQGARRRARQRGPSEETLGHQRRHLREGWDADRRSRLAALRGSLDGVTAAVGSVMLRHRARSA
eukprot:7869135-Pyramimonas_sp.AAC.1